MQPSRRRSAEKKWRMVPDERKPDFKRAARVIMQRALGHETVGKEPELQVHSGLMHEHPEREARLIERTLRNGVVPPQVRRAHQAREELHPGGYRASTRTTQRSSSWTHSISAAGAMRDRVEVPTK